MSGPKRERPDGSRTFLYLSSPVHAGTMERRIADDER